MRRILWSFRVLLARAIAAWYAFEHRQTMFALAWSQSRRADAINEDAESRRHLEFAREAEQRACRESELAYQRLLRAELHAQIEV